MGDLMKVDLVVDARTEEAVLLEINAEAVVAHSETQEVLSETKEVVHEVVALAMIEARAEAREVMAEEVMIDEVIAVMIDVMEGLTDAVMDRAIPILEAVPEEIRTVNPSKNFVNSIQKTQLLVRSFSCFPVQWRRLLLMQRVATAPASSAELVLERKCSNPDQEMKILLKPSNKKKQITKKRARRRKLKNYKQSSEN